jgi:hypothetical protein
MTAGAERGALGRQADGPRIEDILRDVWDAIQTLMIIVDERMGVL